MQPNVILTLIVSTCAREIIFPPVTGVQHPFSSFNIDEHDGKIDVSSPVYAGLTTYANLPYVHCLAIDAEDIEKYDIAILGAPFDTVGVTISLTLHAPDEIKGRSCQHVTRN